MAKYTYIVCLCLLVMHIVGCSGVKTFPDTVQVGETAAIAAGWKRHFSREDITVTITPEVGAPVTYNAGHPSIRSVINLYADPLSSLIVSDEKNTDITNSAQTYAQQVKFNYTGDDKDYWQTIVFLDIPSISTGLATIQISNSVGEIETTAVNIVPGSGTAFGFEATGVGPLTDFQLQAMERVDHYVVSFTGAVIPHAVQLELSYSTLNGYLVNPRGDLKNIAWTDTGSGYRVILTVANKALASMNDLKFYVAVAFGINGTTTVDIVPGSIQAFDRNGDSIAGVDAALTFGEGTAGLVDVP